MTKTPTYKCWVAMIERCENPNATKFHNYGGRGIKVCQRWRDSFEAFLADMGVRPNWHSIDRFPNKDGDYEPGNCRWATLEEQGRNKRNNRLVTHDGLTLTLVEWSERTGLDQNLIGRRIADGWDAKDALATPPGLEKTHCPQGHPYSGENLFVRKNGKRECKTCMRLRSRAYRMSQRF